MATQGGNRAIIAALLANLTIALLKFIAWGLTRSSAMLAEAIHSVADSGNQLLLLFGARQAKRDADTRHPFGYGRERYLYAFMVAIILFSLGGLFAIYESIEKFREPHGIEGPWWWVPLAVLIGAIIAESRSFSVAIQESNRVRNGESWISFIRNAKAPELPVILIEDFGALLGLVFALFGVSLTLITGNGVFDAIATLMIGILLVVLAATLGIEIKSLLIGESASAKDVAAIEKAITADGTQLIHVKTVHVGPEELLVAAKFAVKPGASGTDIAEHINAIETRIREAVPIARIIYLEPDIYGAQNRSHEGAEIPAPQKP
ncbi:cation diffusion facilitator family transporter [Haematomicrobium sanguinis]|uniref:cation diffusion facilitator family transporter n=1 Tax=Haematomicrobium sanguinis TaxID=479106 RepID=UPI000691DB08|nr:cation diffusion facilitator family transporter [Haematomicrobium sanguinis]